MLCDRYSDSMPVRLGQFYAFVLLLACLVINIAFFAEVREPFLGDEDPMASVKSAFSDLDIQAKLAEFYPPMQSKVNETKIGEISDKPSLAPLEREKSIPKAEISTPKEGNPILGEQRQQSVPPVNVPPVVADPMIDPFLPLTQPSPAKTEQEIPKEPAPAIPAVALERREPNRQTAAIIPAPVTAIAQPVIADQFKPIVIEPKPAAPVKPLSTPVWETPDTVLDRPIRYD